MDPPPLGSRISPAPMPATNRRVFGIKQPDRLSHMYIIGKTGTGKSTLLERLVLSDIEAGEGLALVDPHGDLAERIAARIPAHRRGDLIYLNVPDRSQPYGYNPLKRVTPETPAARRLRPPRGLREDVAGGLGGQDGAHPPERAPRAPRSAAGLAARRAQASLG